MKKKKSRIKAIFFNEQNQDCNAPVIALNIDNFNIKCVLIDLGVTQQILSTNGLSRR